jgi:arsenate reductase
VVVAGCGAVVIFAPPPTPRLLTAADAAWADVVITMGCDDACPFVPGKRYLDWELDDPGDRPLAAVRLVRDEIARRIDELMPTLEREVQPGATP